MSHSSPASDTVIEWLLAGDPSIRWQVMKDLQSAPKSAVAAERARVEHEGWGARLLALEDDDGLWAGGAFFPADYERGEPGQPWTATLHTLQTLKILGLPAESESARQAIALIAENGRWDHAGERYFDGEVEPCINGRVVEAGAYFGGVDVAPIVDRLLEETMDEGGWNCEAENGSVRASIDTTINVLEGLLEFENATGESAAVRDARRAGEEFLLERQLFRRKSSGEIVFEGFLDMAFPYYWVYDVLRALDYFRISREPDRRMSEAVSLIREKQQPDGRWPLERIHPGRVHFDIESPVGTPSRWNTLRALRVLDWWDGAAAG